MSRSDSFMGLSPRAVAMVAYAKKEFSGDQVEGLYREIFPLRQYIMTDGRILKEFVAFVECHSGPCHFLALKDARGHTVRKSKWRLKEIRSALGYEE